MSGKYNGPSFDAAGNSTGSWLETVTGTSQASMDIYHANKAAEAAASVPSPGYSGAGPGTAPVVSAGPTRGPGVLLAGTPASVGPGARGTVSGGGATGTGAGNAGALNFGGRVLKLSDPKKDTATSITMFGVPVDVNRGFSDVNRMEQRYGDSEILTTAFGIGVLAADVANSVWNSQKWLRDGVGVVKESLAPQSWQPTITINSPTPGAIYNADPMRQQP